jgi:hypothetical protein
MIFTLGNIIVKLGKTQGGGFDSFLSAKSLRFPQKTRAITPFLRACSFSLKSRFVQSSFGVRSAGQ